MSKKIGLSDVKIALKDSRFRNSLPEEIKPDIMKYLSNPGCACNVPLYRKILKDCTEQLLLYFPDKTEIIDEKKQIEELAKNNWMVINCHVDELEGNLKKLPPGRKQIAVTRFEDQVTVVINELEYVF